MSNKIFVLDNFKGLNTAAFPSQIDDNESPDMCNFELDMEGVLRKRFGYEIQDSFGIDEPINATYFYLKTNVDTGHEEVLFLVHAGHNLYKKDMNSPDPGFYKVSRDLNNGLSKFFTMKQACYILDGLNYWEFDGDTLKKPTPYIPEMFRNNEPLEDFNLLGTWFKSTFSPDGTERTFFLGVKELLDDRIKVSFDGGITYITYPDPSIVDVNIAEGTVTFKEAPKKGIATLVIQAQKDNAKKSNNIEGCTLRAYFGGTNDTRVLLSGNKLLPNRIWRSGLYDPTYYPENGFIDIGADIEPVMNFSKQYDTCVVVKERGAYALLYNPEKLSFYSKPINEESGTCAKNSVQIVNNAPTWLDKYKGVMCLVQTNVKDERNVVCISSDINNKLLKEPNLHKALSLDFNNKYHLFINGKAYIYDIRRKMWFLFDNIHPTCIYSSDCIYFGDKHGHIQRFKDSSHLYPYNDNGKPINAYWYSKLLSFGADYREKTVRKIFYSLFPYKSSSIHLSVSTNNTAFKEISDERQDLMEYYPFRYFPASYLNLEFPLSKGVKSKLKKIVYMQVKIENNNLDESLDLISLSFEILMTRFRK